MKRNAIRRAFGVAAVAMSGMLGGCYVPVEMDADYNSGKNDNTAAQVEDKVQFISCILDAAEAANKPAPDQKLPDGVRYPPSSNGISFVEYTAGEVVYRDENGEQLIDIYNTKNNYLATRKKSACTFRI